MDSYEWGLLTDFVRALRKKGTETVAEINDTITDEDEKLLRKWAAAMVTTAATNMLEGIMSDTLLRNKNTPDVYNQNLASQLSRLLREWQLLGLYPSRYFAQRDIIEPEWTPKYRAVILNSLEEAFRAFVLEIGYVPDFPGGAFSICKGCGRHHS